MKWPSSLKTTNYQKVTVEERNDLNNTLPTKETEFTVNILPKTENPTPMWPHWPIYQTFQEETVLTAHKLFQEIRDTSPHESRIALIPNWTLPDKKATGQYPQNHRHTNPQTQ